MLSKFQYVELLNKTPAPLQSRSFCIRIGCYNKALDHQDNFQLYQNATEYYVKLLELCYNIMISYAKGRVG